MKPGSTEGAVDLEKKAQRITTRSHKNADDIEKRRELNRLESEAGEIEQKIREIQKELKEIPRTESRLYALVEEGFVRLKLRSKPLADAVRITGRNIFIRPLYIFRRLWDNHRNDHAVLRALTRSSGAIVPRGNTLEVVLRPELDLQPAETVNP